MSDLDHLVTEAAEILLAGGVVLLPTDTVYGLAAAAAQPDAVEKLFALKDRPSDRTIAVLVATREQARHVGAFNDDAETLAIAHWPGALTMVIPARPDAPAAVVSEVGGIGLRQPASTMVRLIADAVGPLATTSANRAGQPTPAEAHECAAQLVGEPDLVIDGGELSGAASTVVISGDHGWKVAREGVIASSVIGASVKVESDLPHR